MNNLTPSFFDFFRYTSLTDRRQKQLAEEKKVDVRLYSCYTKCPCDVFEYLMKSRELNRALTKKVHDASLLDTSSAYESTLTVVDNAQSISQGNPIEMCNRIRGRTAYMNEILKMKD